MIFHRLEADPGDRGLRVGRALTNRCHTAPRGGTCVSSLDAPSQTSATSRQNRAKLNERRWHHAAFLLLRCSKKKTKGQITGGGMSYVNSSFDKAPLVRQYNANGQAASRDGSLSAFNNNGAPRIPRATPVTRLDSMEMSGAGRRNAPPAGRNAVSNPSVRAQRTSEEKDSERLQERSRPMSMYMDCDWKKNIFFFPFLLQIYEDEISPYSESRPQSHNPYASAQGNRNPYAREDSRRRY